MVTEKGYNTQEGYVGFTTGYGNGSTPATMLFASEADYKDYINDNEEQDWFPALHFLYFFTFLRRLYKSYRVQWL